MRFVRTIVGWTIGLGLFAILITVVVPGFLNERCKERWESLRLKATWLLQTGCMVRVGGALVREQYVILPDPTVRK